MIFSVLPGNLGWGNVNVKFAFLDCTGFRLFKRITTFPASCIVFVIPGQSNIYRWKWDWKTVELNGIYQYGMELYINSLCTILLWKCMCANGVALNDSYQQSISN